MPPSLVWIILHCHIFVSHLLRPLQKKLALRAFFACIVRIDALEYPTGEMAEWSNAFDLKSNVVKATEGSNPSLSVNNKKATVR